MGNLGCLILAMPVTHDAPVARRSQYRNFTPDSPRRRDRNTKAAYTIRPQRVRTLSRRRVLWGLPRGLSSAA